MDAEDEDDFARVTANDEYSRLDKQIDAKSNEIKQLSQELKQNFSDFRKLVQVLKQKIYVRIPEDKARFDETKLQVLVLIETMDSLANKAVALRDVQINSQVDLLVQRNCERTRELHNSFAAYDEHLLATSQHPSPGTLLLRYVVSTQLFVLLMVLVVIIWLL